MGKKWQNLVVIVKYFYLYHEGRLNRHRPSLCQLVWIFRIWTSSSFRTMVVAVNCTLAVLQCYKCFFFILKVSYIDIDLVFVNLSEYSGSGPAPFGQIRTNWRNLLMLVKCCYRYIFITKVGYIDIVWIFRIWTGSSFRTMREAGKGAAGSGLYCTEVFVALWIAV